MNNPNIWNPTPLEAYEYNLTYTKYMAKRHAHIVLLDIEHVGYEEVKRRELTMRLKAEAMRRVMHNKDKWKDTLI